MTGLFDATLDRLAPVDLARLDEAARLLTRRDRKYVVPTTEAAELIRQLAGSSSVLAIGGKRRFAYESVYFDTTDLDTYLAAARGRPRRYKVRIRTYLDSGRQMLEIKRRDGRGNTDKSRTDHTAGSSNRLDDHGRAFIAADPVVAVDAGALAPILRTTYQRSTLLLGDGQRLTIDTDLRSVASDGRAVELVDMAIIETKASQVATTADRQLWANGHRPIRLSKFCTSLAAIDPTLPSNRWTRALQQPWVVSGSTWDRPAYLV